MQLSLNPEILAGYVRKQIQIFFPDQCEIDVYVLREAINLALQRVEVCFTKINLKAYFFDGQVFFSHLHSDQYLTFLWFLSNTLWSYRQDQDLATRVYYLNKALHGFDCMYSTTLPEVFFVAHGVGTVLGRATYGNYFYVSAGCVVGAHRGEYPILGEGVGLGAGAAVIGKCIVGDYASIGSGVQIFKRNIPDGSVAYRKEDGSLNISQSNTSLSRTIFRL